MIWKLAAITVALTATAAYTEGRVYDSTAPMKVKVDCWNCITTAASGCPNPMVVHHRIPQATEIEPEPGEGDPWEVEDGPEGCHQGHCLAAHDECGALDSAEETMIVEAVRGNDLITLQRVLNGRTIALDFRNKSLDVLTCDGDEIVLRVKGSGALLTALLKKQSQAD